jgi:chlorite dismutase
MNGQYIAYTFFRVDPAWRRLPVEERSAAKDAFADVLDEFEPRFDALRLYTTTGVRPDVDFFLWKITERYEDLGELGAALNATPLTAWLETPYSYLATTKASQYTAARRARRITPKGSPYLVVYPFVKVRPWYGLSEEDRQRAMDEHIRIGRDEFPTIHNHTSYSFGIDDQEFMTAFECDEPADFMHLMLRLRDSEASRFTERDTPIFVGQHLPVREALARLDGVSRRGRRAVASSGEAALVEPGAHGRVAAHHGHDEEGERVAARQVADQEPAEIDDEKADGAVEHPLLPRRPGLDLAPAEVAPEEVGDNGDCDEEGEPQERPRGRERRLLVQDDHRQRDRGQDQQVPDEWADVSHAVM